MKNEKALFLLIAMFVVFVPHGNAMSLVNCTDILSRNAIIVEGTVTGIGPLPGFSHYIIVSLNEGVGHYS